MQYVMLIEQKLYFAVAKKVENEEYCDYRNATGIVLHQLRIWRLW